jgi:hypothetical protein
MFIENTLKQTTPYKREVTLDPNSVKEKPIKPIRIQLISKSTCNIGTFPCVSIRIVYTLLPGLLYERLECMYNECIVT